MELVWRDRQPRDKAEGLVSIFLAWLRERYVFRCWAVSEEPAVCAWKRSIKERGSLAPSVRHDPGPLDGARPRYLRFLQKIVVGVEEKES